MEKPKARRNGRRTSAVTGSFMRTSRGTKAFLKLLRYILSFYVAIMVFSQYTLQSGVGRMPVFSVKSKAVPATLRLKLKSRRRNEGSMCRKGFGAKDDPYFAPYGGVFCGSSLYEARPSGSPEDQVRRVALTYKTFKTDELAQDYFWRFWGIHSHSILSPNLMIDVTANVGNQGDVGHEHHTLYFNPSLLVSAQEEEVYASAHMVHAFRQGKIIIMFDVSGFYNVPSPNINPELIKSMSAAVAESVQVPDSFSNVIRKTAWKTLRFGHNIDGRIVRVLNTFGHLAASIEDSIDAEIKELEKSTLDFYSDISTNPWNSLHSGTEEESMTEFNTPDEDRFDSQDGIGDAFSGSNDTNIHENTDSVDDSFDPHEGQYLRAWTESVHIPVAQGWNETSESDISVMAMPQVQIEGISVIQPQADTAVSTKPRSTFHPVYFGEDKDLSEELDYQGDFVPHEETQTKNEFVMFNQLNEFLRTLPFSDLSSSATMIAFVLVLLGAGELIDPLKPIASTA